MINERVLLKKPIWFKKVCQIYPPTVNDMLDDDFSFFHTILAMSQEELEDAYVNDNVPQVPTPFQYLLMSYYQDKELQGKILKGFEKLIGEPVTIVPELEVIIIGKSEEELDPRVDLDNPRTIDKDTFFDFQNVVRNAVGAPAIEPPVEDEDPRVKRIKALGRKRERLAAKRKGGTNFGTLIAAICCMGNGINPLNVGEMSYASIPILIGMSQQKEEYDIDIRALLAGADKQKVKPKYWIRDLK